MGPRAAGRSRSPPSSVRLTKTYFLRLLSPPFGRNQTRIFARLAGSLLVGQNNLGGNSHSLSPRQSTVDHWRYSKILSSLKSDSLHQT
jgi:hypothetical protein